MDFASFPINPQLLQDEIPLRVGLPWGNVLPVWDEESNPTFYQISGEVLPTEFVGNRALGAIESSLDIPTPAGKLASEEIIWKSLKTAQIFAPLRTITGYKPGENGMPPTPIFGQKTANLPATELGELPAALTGGQPFMVATQSRESAQTGANKAQVSAAKNSYPGALVKEFGQIIGRLMLSAATSGEEFWLVHTDLASRESFPLIHVTGFPLPDGSIAFEITCPAVINDASWQNASAADNLHSAATGKSQNGYKASENSELSNEPNNWRVLRLQLPARALFGENLDSTPTPGVLLQLSRPVTMATLQLSKPWLVRPIFLRDAKHFEA